MTHTQDTILSLIRSFFSGTSLCFIVLDLIYVHLFNDIFFRNIQIIFWHLRIDFESQNFAIYDNFYKAIKFLDFNFIEKCLFT